MRFPELPEIFIVSVSEELSGMFTLDAFLLYPSGNAGLFITVLCVMNCSFGAEPVVDSLEKPEILQLFVPPVLNDASIPVVALSPASHCCRQAERVCLRQL